jgi:Tol biopolymer transport system component
MRCRAIGWCALAVLIATGPVGAQEIVFSRRVYAARGATFQQLWSWSASDGRLTQLTRTARSHDNPVCSPDGAAIFFGAAIAGLEEQRWRFDRRNGTEQRVAAGATPRGTRRPDGPAPHVPGCDDRTWAAAPDGSRAACTVNGEELAIVDLTIGSEIDRIRFDQRASSGDRYPPWPLDSIWSPDGRTLLVGTYGEASSSTSSFLDFFLLDLPTRTWTRAMSGSNPVWLANGDAIVFETPRMLVPLPPPATGKVWSSHLARFDVATRTELRLTSGVTNNVQPTLCGG